MISVLERKSKVIRIILLKIVGENIIKNIKDKVIRFYVSTDGDYLKELFRW